jgi:glycosyltransferase involved in cell wall biosynthesis
VQRFWLDAIPHRRSVLRIADRMSAMGNQTPHMLEDQRRLVQACDLVAYTARTLEPDVAAMGARRSMYLPNGVDYMHYAAGDCAVPPDLSHIPRPIAVYLGAIEEWFDFATLNSLTAELPWISFVLIGPDRLARGRLTPRPNLHLLGRRPYALIPGYLHNSDVGLIPFDTKRYRDLIRSVHPLKLYEYLACGLPVVATHWEELALLNSPAILCRDPHEFAAAVTSCLSRDPDPARYQAFAAAADWQGRVKTLIDGLDLA